MIDLEPEAAPEESPRRGLGAIDEDSLFTGNLVTSQPRTRTRWQRIGGRTSFVLHAVALLLIIFVPIFTPPELPEQRDYIRALLYDPPRRRRPPCPGGRG